MHKSTPEECAIERRGVLASYEHVTTRSKDIDDMSKFKLTIRDAVALLIGIAGMWGTQVATQSGMRSDIRDLGTKFENYQSYQNGRNTYVDLQLDDIRKDVKMNREKVEDVGKSFSEMKGILLGAGIKGVKP